MEDILYLMDHLRFGVCAEEDGGFVDIDFFGRSARHSVQDWS